MNDKQKNTKQIFLERRQDQRIDFLEQQTRFSLAAAFPCINHRNSVNHQPFDIHKIVVTAKYNETTFRPNKYLPSKLRFLIFSAYHIATTTFCILHSYATHSCCDFFNIVYSVFVRVCVCGASAAVSCMCVCVTVQANNNNKSLHRQDAIYLCCRPIAIQSQVK